MNIDLAAFRLNALAALTRSSSSSAGASSNADFLGALLNAQRAQAALNPSNVAAASAAQAPAGLDSIRAADMLAQLQASNAAFMKRYNDRVERIGDESKVLGQLRSRVAELGQASQGLEQLDARSSNAAIKDAIKGFVERYNAWDQEFDPYFADGALLDDNQAGEVARFSLRREVGSVFHGAGNGGFAKGLTDMGVSFSADGQLKLDEARFDQVLASQREGAVRTLNNVARAFGDAARTLAADGHLLDRRIDNANRALAWAAENQAAVEAEFGPNLGASSNSANKL